MGGSMTVRDKSATGRGRSLNENLERARRVVETAPESLPPCVVPSNALIYAFLAEICKRQGAREQEKTCEEESGSQLGSLQGRPSSFVRNLRVAMDNVVLHPKSIGDVESLLCVKGVGPKIADLVASAMFGAVDGGGGAETRERMEREGQVGGSPDQAGVVPQQKAYIPRFGSANYAFLIVLYREQHGERGRPYLTKTELMDLAEASGLSSKPIHSRGGGSARFHGAQASRTYYNGWSNFKTLVNNGLVRTWGSPKKIGLTEAGAVVAARLSDGAGAIGAGAIGAGAIGAGAIGATIEAMKDSDVDIVLLVDSREQYARSLADKLPGVEVRGLPIGDAIWVARPRGDNASENGKEYVLNYVIERKSLEDLLHSVRDGSRYHSQKYRLQQCGLRNLYYLVEGDVESLSSSADYKLVGTACAKTSAIDGFNVLRTKSFAESLAVLTRMTRSIRKSMNQVKLDEATARSMGLMTFSEFRDRCVRLTNDANCVRDVWSVMLNEVPGMGRAAVERGIFSDKGRQTCRGFYLSRAATPTVATSAAAKVDRVERVVATLFFPR